MAVFPKKKTKARDADDQGAERLVSALDDHLSKFSVEERLERTQKALLQVKSYLTAGGSRSKPVGRDCTPQTRLAARTRP